MSSLPKTFLTPEQYLEIERKAEFKSEYFQGEMFAMAGASLAHNRLVFNTIAAIGPQLRAGLVKGFLATCESKSPRRACLLIRT